MLVAHIVRTNWRAFLLDEDAWRVFDDALRRPAEDVAGLRELLTGPTVLAHRAGLSRVYVVRSTDHPDQRVVGLLRPRGWQRRPARCLPAASPTDPMHLLLMKDLRRALGG